MYHTMLPKPDHKDCLFPGDDTSRNGILSLCGESLVVETRKTVHQRRAWTAFGLATVGSKDDRDNKVAARRPERGMYDYGLRRPCDRLVYHRG